MWPILRRKNRSQRAEVRGQKNTFSILSLHGRKGFTIIELLVAGVILTILIGGVTAIFLAANRSWRQTEARLEIYQNARDALGQISRELTTAFPSTTVGPLNGGNHIPLKLDNETYAKDGITYDKDQLTFVAAYNGEYDLTHLGYRLNTSDLDDIKLQRYKKNFGSDDYQGDPYDGSTLEDEPEQTWKEMALYVISLNFRCYNDSTSNWQNDWNETTLPKAVEITIKVQDKQKRYEPMEFRNIVYIPTS
jgi:prepilin-type N-terminal cleavage/methylation domain-containing protein